MECAIFLGFDPRSAESQGFAVARHSIQSRLSKPAPIFGLALSELRAGGLYKRPTYKRGNRLWDGVSDAGMSTEFAISRFLVPYIAARGLALFADADVMARVDLMQLFECYEPGKACMVVKHDYTPKGDTKMQDQAQAPYARKNWSSVVLWNCDHPSAKRLTPAVVNESTGLWLHQFSWLDDDEIGELDPCWNHLVGELPPNPDAKLVHFTEGTPNMDGYENCEFADEWRKELTRWAVGPV